MKKDIKQSLLTGKGKDFRSVIAKFMDSVTFPRTGTEKLNNEM